MSWKLTQPDGDVAFRVLPDGGMESCAVDSLPPGTEIAPADAPPQQATIDPISKLQAFLAANPDVVAVLL